MNNYYLSMSKNKLKTMNFSSLGDREKVQLRNRIMDSVFSYKRKRQFLRYSIGVAASILTILSIGFYNSYNSSSSIDRYVKTIASINSDTLQNAKLILSDNQNIEIAEEQSKISYANSGQNVKIGSSKTISLPKLEENEMAYNTVMVPYGKRSQIKLSDGTKVWLNSGSKLVYPVVFAGNKREVYLEGEGVFEVTHDKNHPFIVSAKDHEIEVLGTVFNVTNYADESQISTVLKSGSVQLNYKGDSFFKSNQSIKISPGTIAIYDRETSSITADKVSVDKYFSWREGVFIFKNDGLALIMKKLSRYYNREIIMNNKDLANQTFSGHLDLKANLEDVIKLINETANFKYEVVNQNSIIIN